MNSQTVMLVIGVIAVLWLIAGYNKAITLRNYVREAFATMDVYLKKRWDLIPNLLENVKGYASYEKEVLNKITELRNTNYSGLNNSEKIDLNAQLDLGLSRLLAVAENYPDLKANQSYNMLMEQLSQIEDEIANSRKYYNGTVRTLNNYTEMFPSNLICSVFAVKREKMFEIDETQRANVKVSF